MGQLSRSWQSAAISPWRDFPLSLRRSSTIPRLRDGETVATRLRVVDSAFAPPPVSKRKISAYHPAKMRKVRNALVSSENPAKQFKKRVQDYEHDRWHWNWRNQQHDGPAREKKAEGQQNSEDRARCPDGWIHARRSHH